MSNQASKKGTQFYRHLESQGKKKWLVSLGFNTHKMKHSSTEKVLSLASSNMAFGSEMAA